VAVDNRRAELRSLFGELQWVKRTEFEALLRRALYYEGADVDPVEEKRRDDPWSALDEFGALNRYVERLDASGIAEPIVNPLEDFPKHRGGRPKKQAD
jgi:hypothetical protein